MFLLRPRAARSYSSLPPSPHAQWYSDVLPPMIPIFLLGSAVYLGLQLTQLKLAHEKYIDESTQRIQQLEHDIATLRAKRLAAPLPEHPTAKKTSWW